MVADRERVIDAAVALVEREGESGLGFNKVARALGIKPPSLYSHVAGHDELRALVVMRGWERFLRAAEAARGRRRGGAALRAVAAAYRSFARQHLGLFRLMESVPIGPEHVEFAPVLEALLDLFRVPLTELGSKPRDLIHHARALRAAVHGFVSLETQHQFGRREDVDESFDRLLTTLIRGIEPRRSP